MQTITKFKWRCPSFWNERENKLPKPLVRNYSSPMQLGGVKKKLHVTIWCTSEYWNSYLFGVWLDVMTLQSMTDENEQPVLSSGGWRVGVGKKDAGDIIKRVIVLEGGRSEGSITRMHTAGMRTNILFKWQQRAGLSPPRRGSWKITTEAQKRKQMSVQFAVRRSSIENCSPSISSNFSICHA